jgi:ankyrin repeat protein
LLRNGADVNAQGGRHGNALRAASIGGHESVVRLLLDKGADIKAQTELCGDDLHAAILEGHEAVVELLLEKGDSDQGEDWERSDDDSWEI